MITRDQMFEPLLAACPSFAPAWSEFCADWKDGPGEPPLYLALGDLARHVIQLFEAGELNELPPIFQVLERWHIDGDAYVREAATIGFLEGLQNNSGHRGLDAAAFEPWLLPESKKWWDKLNRFWTGDASALRE